MKSIKELINNKKEQAPFFEEADIKRLIDEWLRKAAHGSRAVCVEAKTERVCLRVPSPAYRFVVLLSEYDLRETLVKEMGFDFNKLVVTR